MSDILGYRGKKVVVSGCFSGMGEATARILLDLGAEVHGLDFKDCALPLASFTRMDLRDEASIEAAANAISGPVDALFNCAGLPNHCPKTDIMKVNFLGLRKLTNLLVPKMRDGSAIACIASTAGRQWQQRLDKWLEMIATPDFASGLAWYEANLDIHMDAYSASKEALCVWTMSEGAELIKRGVRLNTILPGPTITPMMPEFEKTADKAIIDFMTQPSNRYSSPEEQAGPLIFLNSALATYVNGVPLVVDGGFTGAENVGKIDWAKMPRRSQA